MPQQLSQPLAPLKNRATLSSDTDMLPHTMAASTDMLMPIMASDHTTRTSGDTIHTTMFMLPHTTLLLITSMATEMLTTPLTHPMTTMLLLTTYLNLHTRDTTPVENIITMDTLMRVFSQKDTLR